MFLEPWRLVMNAAHAGALFLLLLCGSDVPAAEATVAPPMLEPIFRLKAEGVIQRFVTSNELAVAKAKPAVEGIAFLAVCTNEWLPGLVPIFAIEKTNRWELRRLPPRGQENGADPFFFALPPEDEPQAANIAGRWRVDAVRGDRSQAWFAWELAVDAEGVAGRFDPNSDYRVAFINGGTFRSNQFELRVEYIMAFYTLTGNWRGGTLRGDWRHEDGSERGTWEARREPIRLPAGAGTIALYEWRRPRDNARRYGVEGEALEPGWERARRPLCRVWQAPRAR